MTKIHIAFGFDHGYVMPCGIAMLSICKNRNLPIVFHAIVDVSVTMSDRSILCDIAQEYGCEVLFYQVDTSRFEGLYQQGYINLSTYLRFLIPELCPSELDRIIYLDSDLIVRSPLDELWNMSIPVDVCYAAALGFSGSNVLYLNALDLPITEPYYNAGVLLINLDYWRKNDVSGECLKYIREKRPKLMDQDALNALYRGHIMRLHFEYNLQAHFYSCSEYYWEVEKSKYFQEIRSAMANPVILHYSRSIKPWHLGFVGPNEWLSYYQMSPWKDVPLAPPITKAVTTRSMLDEIEQDYGYWLDRYAPAFLALFGRAMKGSRWPIILINKLCKLLLKSF